LIYRLIQNIPMIKQENKNAVVPHFYISCVHQRNI
jgi:hypothetical protein